MEIPVLPVDDSLTDDEELLLGIDARAPWPSGIVLPDLYKLRTDVAGPASADPLVWNRILDIQKRKAPGWRESTGLTHSAEEWTRLLPTDEPRWLVGLTVRLGGLADELRSWWRGVLYDHRPRSASERAWPLLGYDVCDGSLLSALCNCGYDDHEVAALRHRWSSQLNGYHLFTDPDDARQFCAVSDGRVPEHAPFAVIGVFRIPE